MSFQTAYNAVLNWEGVYDNDLDDSGGETAYGITRKYQAGWAGWVEVERLKAAGVHPSEWIHDIPLMKAVEGYYLILWTTLGLDEVQDADLQACIFGAAVNQGYNRAIQWLQESLEEIGHSVGIDGVIGPKTWSGIKRAEGMGQGKALRSCLIAKRTEAYLKAATSKASNGKFLVGWLNRLFGGA